MNLIDELIEKLPKELADFVYPYVPVLVRFTDQEILIWIGLIAEGNWQSAYKNLLEQMTTEEVSQEMDKSIASFGALNQDNAEWIAFQKQIILGLMTLGLLVLKSKLLAEST